MSISTSANLDLPQLTTNQTDKETTVNDALGQVDSKLTGLIAIDCSTPSQAPVTSDLQSNAVVSFINVTTAYSVAMPTFVGTIKVISDDTNTDTLTLTRGATSKAMAPGDTTELYFDGTSDGMFSVGGGAPSGGTVPTGGTSGQVLTKNSSTDFDTSWTTPTGGGGGGGGAAVTGPFNDFLFVVTAIGGGATSIAELEVYETIGGSREIPDSQSDNDHTSTHDASLTQDADTSTYYQNSGSGWKWVKLHYNTAITPVQMKITGRQDMNFGENVLSVDLYGSVDDTEYVFICKLLDPATDGSAAYTATYNLPQAQSGGGGGGSGLDPYSPPTASMFTPDSNMTLADSSTNRGMVITHDWTVHDQSKCIKTLPTGSSWTVTARMKIGYSAGQFPAMGIMLHDSANNKQVWWGPQSDNGVSQVLGQYTSALAFSSNPVLANIGNGEMEWFRIVNDAGTLHFLASGTAGETFEHVWSASLTAWAPAIDNVGFIMLKSADGTYSANHTLSAIVPYYLEEPGTANYYGAAVV